MSTISYDSIKKAFLHKIETYKFISSPEVVRDDVVDGYMRRAVSAFRTVCLYDLTLRDDEKQEFTDSFADGDIDEIVDIISEGMIEQWMKPFVYQQDNLENVLTTRDYTQYSPSKLLDSIGSAYKKVQEDFVNKIRSYSFNHGDLTDLHL